MEKTALTNEIFAYGKNVFRGLHNLYGFDFEAPHTIFRVDGCYTVSSVKKLAYVKGAAHGAAIVVLFSGGGYCGLHAVRLFTDNCDVDVAGNDRMALEDSFYNTAHKSDFANIRKCDRGFAYVVFQNAEYVKNPVSPYRYVTGWNERFRLVSPREGWWYRDTFSYEILIDENGKKLSGGFRSYCFDKSGYCVGNRRTDLCNRANNVRAERKRAEINKADVVAKALAIDAALMARKAELINMLLSATSRHDFAKVGKAIGVDTWNAGYARAVYQAETFKERMKNDSFTSVSDVEYYYNNVMENLK